MDNLDQIASRVTLAGSIGALGGVATSLFKGTPMGRTVGLTAFSCAMTGTACFGAERCAAMVSSKFFHHDSGAWEDVLLSHSIGGIVGGSLLGSLYKSKPIHGVAFFLPLMLLIGTGEKLFQDVREERMQQMVQEQAKSKG
jgi:hypothetical protein